ncbi:hypothetical protein GOV14_03430 [Candidatus Pacearchaeota archaeon]|nr:hypothetical protein [Candidatus Pacearchaeota archaeon]
MVIFKFRHKSAEFSLNVFECKTILQKASGLMFRRKSGSLLFHFKKYTREPIHSFFCVPFLAIWFCDEKIVDFRYVKPWQLSVRSRKKFNKLLEIPNTDEKFAFFLDKFRKI